MWLGEVLASSRGAWRRFDLRAVRFVNSASVVFVFRRRRLLPGEVLVS